MKKYYLKNNQVNYLLSELETKIGVPFDTWDCREGVLVDSFIGSFCKDGYVPLTIMCKEHYLNPWSSDLEVTIARTEGDNKKLDKRWYEFAEAYDAEYPEEEEV